MADPIDLDEVAAWLARFLRALAVLCFLLPTAIAIGYYEIGVELTVERFLAPIAIAILSGVLGLLARAVEPEGV